VKIELSDGQEIMKIDTDILWWIELDTPKSFDEILTGVLLNLKKRGFKVTENLENYDGWDYIYSNLDKGQEILA